MQKKIKSKIKAVCVFGTRPEAVKMCPLVLEMKKRPEIDTQVIVTAQHRELLDSVLNLFGVTPDADLNIMRHGQSLTDITTRALTGIGETLQEIKPDIMLVHGDTATTFAAALAAFYAGVKVAHVEAGLRTHNKLEPYPEEMNRLLTTRLTDLYFCPTVHAKENLIRENISAKDMFVTGNTEIDAVYTVLGRKNWSGYKNEAFNIIDFTKKIIIMTSHRTENLGAPMEGICRAMARIVNENPDIQLVWPMHPNQKVRDTAKAFLGGLDRIILTEAAELEDMYRLINSSHMTVSDSGAIQEISAPLNKPCVVLRNVTERPEGIQTGALIMGGNNEESVYKAVSSVLSDKALYKRMAEAKNPFGDGRASSRITEGLLYYFGLINGRPEDFVLK